jgi:hypothetical protein
MWIVVKRNFHDNWRGVLHCVLLSHAFLFRDVYMVTQWGWLLRDDVLEL